MRKLALFVPLAVALTAVAAFAAADMADYCQVPPTVNTVIPPNILLMVDGTGSMSTAAYTSSTYNPNVVYEGYFDPVLNYKQVAGSDIWVEDVDTGAACNRTCTVAWTCNKNAILDQRCEAAGWNTAVTKCTASNKPIPCCSNPAVDYCPNTDTGNHLNYLHMTRMDGIHWALTGGTPLGCDGTVGRCDASQIALNTPLPGTTAPSICDAAGCVLTMYDGTKVKARWDRLTGNNGGLLYKLQGLPIQPRIGLMLFDSTTAAAAVSGNVLIGDFKPAGPPSYDAAHPYQNTIAAVNAKNPGNSTPTGPALRAAQAYFAQQPAVNGGPAPQSTASGSIDQWKNPLYQCNDKDNDGYCGCTATGASCTDQKREELVLMSCAKNFIILLSDGEWNIGEDPVGAAYEMHKLGFNNPALLPSERRQINTIYSIGLWLAAGSSGERAMHHIAMYGGFDTSAGQWPGGTTQLPNTSLTVLLPNPSFSDWDKDWNNTSATGYRIPDTYMSASSASAIKNQIASIILDLMKRATSGTAASVVGSSEGTGAFALQTLFFPKRSFKIGDVAWTSDLMNFWYYMDPYLKFMEFHEDTVREGGAATPPYTLLDLKQDYINRFTNDGDATRVERWEDTSGTGSIDSAASRGTLPMETARAIWRAGFNLWWTEPSARTVYTSLDGSTLTPFTAANGNTLAPYLGQSSSADAEAIIKYARGTDCVDASGADCTCGTAGCGCVDNSGAACACGDPACSGGAKIGRSRTVTTGVCSIRRSPCDSGADCSAGETCVDETHVWKMGDIISSTPSPMGSGQLKTYDRQPPGGYNDQSYARFIRSNDYQNRQLVFSGTNDGMFHAFRLGKLLQKWPDKDRSKWWQVARLEGGAGPGGIGTEAYAFIPKNVLPYLPYLRDEEYAHIYMVDGPITLTDAAINKVSSCSADTDYWDCFKMTTMKTDSPNDVNFADTSWRAVVIGSMGLGGATYNGPTPNPNRIKIPLAPEGPEVGWSSYFALDVTDQAVPKLLWEFSRPDLGVTNVGPAIIREGGGKRCSNNASQTCSTNSECEIPGVATTPAPQCLATNGRWFAVLASGSTGPIVSSEFKGLSDQHLKLFILDLKTGELVRTIDTGIDNAFAGSFSSSVIDFEKASGTTGSYQDDVLYIGYVQKDTVSGEFNKGGVGRLVMNDDSNPDNWQWSQVFADGEKIGPVTSSVVSLVDRKAKKLWLYFGEGRYFYKQDDSGVPSSPTATPVQRRLVGVEDPCFDSEANAIIPTCTTRTILELQDRTSLTAPWDPGKKGWYIRLKAATSASSAERVIAKPVIDPRGGIFFTSIVPTADVCGVGGSFRLWAVDYATGGKVTFLLKGKAIIQSSTGATIDFDLSRDFNSEDGRATNINQGAGLPGGNPHVLSDSKRPLSRFTHLQEE